MTLTSAYAARTSLRRQRVRKSSVVGITFTLTDAGTTLYLHDGDNKIVWSGTFTDGAVAEAFARWVDAD